MEDLLNVRNIEDCKSIATMDAYEDCEVASCWMTCFEDVFPSYQEVEVLGEKAKLIGFDLLDNHIVVGICQKNKIKAKVSLDSIKFIESTKAQNIWVRSYLKYC